MVANGWLLLKQRFVEVIWMLWAVSHVNVQAQERTAPGGPGLFPSVQDLEAANLGNVAFFIGTLILFLRFVLDLGYKWWNNKADRVAKAQSAERAAAAAEAEAKERARESERLYLLAKEQMQRTTEVQDRLLQMVSAAIGASPDDTQAIQIQRALEEHSDDAIPRPTPEELSRE